MSTTREATSEQARKLQKRELNQQRNGADGEDVHMGSAEAANPERRKRRKRAHGDVEMADAEVHKIFSLARCHSPRACSQS